MNEISLHTVMSQKWLKGHFNKDLDKNHKTKYKQCNFNNNTRLKRNSTSHVLNKDLDEFRVQNKCLFFPPKKHHLLQSYTSISATHATEIILSYFLFCQKCS